MLTQDDRENLFGLLVEMKAASRNVARLDMELRQAIAEENRIFAKIGAYFNPLGE